MDYELCVSTNCGSRKRITLRAVRQFLRIFYTHSAILIGLLYFSIGACYCMIGAFINRISIYCCIGNVFTLYAITLGVTLSSVFYVYTEASILSTFLTTMLMFASMSLYGYLTKADFNFHG